MATGDTAARLQQAIVTAMKARDKERLGVLRMLQAAVKQVEVDERATLDDDRVVQVLSSYARKVKDQISASRDGGRDDLLAQAETELAIVGEFLPVELSDAELETLIADTIAEVGASGPRDMGQVMKAVLPKVAGRADGKRVSALVKQKLIG
jgi:uncharacterized protein YqeY